MFVPVELLLEILQHLEKIDLKTVRLVSRSFSRYASGFLFDTVYISDHKVDFDVLSNLAEYPQLSRCVKKLKYDASQFPAMSKQCYMSELGLQLLDMKDPTGQSLQDSPDPDVNGFVETLSNRSDGWSHEANTQEAWRRYSDSSFIQDGYEKFLQHADRLEEVKITSDYWGAVSKKLGYFSNIDCVEMYSLWYLSSADPMFTTLNVSSCGSISHIGSPLNRSWNPIHLFPKQFSYGATRDSPPISSDGTAEFSTLNRILQSHPKRIKYLKTNRAHIPVTAFIAGADVLAALLPNRFKAYDQLRSLSFCILERRFRRDDTLGIPSLPKLLRATTQLRHLALILPGKTDAHVLYYTIQDVFYSRHAVIWPYLQSLDLNRLSTNAVQWIALLAFSMPNLRSLTIFNIELGDSDWQVVVECMHRCLNLCRFRIRRGPGLTYAGHTMVGTQDTPRLTVMEWGTEEHYKFLDRIEHYVVHGGRNPFLQAHQRDDALIEASSKLYASARRLRSRS